MWVQVTQKDIDQALRVIVGTVRANHFKNPIAIALQRGDQHAMVTQTKAHLVAPHEAVLTLPYHAQAFIERWNVSGCVEPISFSL